MPFTLTMPKLSPTMEVGTLVKWHKTEGDMVKEGELLFEVTTDKTTVEYNALDKGFLRKILIKEGEEAFVNQGVAIFTESQQESIEGYQLEETYVKETKTTPPAEKKESPHTAPSSSTTLTQPLFHVAPPVKEDRILSKKATGRISASPLAKKLAKMKGLDLSTIKGSGPNGRIMSRDLRLASFDDSDAVQPSLKQAGSYILESLTPMRQTIGKQLQDAKTFIPHFYIHQDVDVRSMIDLHEQLKDMGVKLTYNDFILRAVALTLRSHPIINSGFDVANNAIIRFQTIDIAVAVSIDGGLITPIIRHVDYKNIRKISQEVKELSSLAREGALQPHQYRGGSFTLSNLGMFGIHSFQAIINPPQSAILAIGGIQHSPTIKEGQIVPGGKYIMLSLSCDHRVIDGVEGARFLQTLKKHLENPAILLI